MQKDVLPSSSRTIDRRGFLGIAAAALSACLLPVHGCSWASDEASVSVTDMGGRSVEIPKTISSVFCSNPIGTVDIYLLSDELLAGINFQPAAADAAYLRSSYTDLPSLGVWMGAGAVPNAEEVLSIAPDVVLCFWSADDAGVSMADAIGESVGLPVLLCDCDLRNLPATLRYLGGLLSCETRAEELASYADDRLSMLTSLAGQLTANEPKTVYLAEGRGGLSTDPVGSLHVTDALEMLGIGNVADLPGTAGQGMGMPTVSIEQIIEWDPSAVLVSEYSMSDGTSSALYDEIRADASWGNVAAVSRGDVFRIPSSPFSWFGRPPSAMRLLGCLWILDRLYPGQTGLDMVSETIDFYRLFLEYELTDDQAHALLGDR